MKGQGAHLKTVIGGGAVLVTTEKGKERAATQQIMGLFSEANTHIYKHTYIHTHACTRAY
jgi:hypothetical protein